MSEEAELVPGPPNHLRPGRRISPELAARIRRNVAETWHLDYEELDEVDTSSLNNPDAPLYEPSPAVSEILLKSQAEFVAE